MKKRKVPLRKSVVSGEMKPKKELIRIAKSKEGEVSIDPTGKKPGRGAYVAIEPEEVEKAWKKKILDRVLETELTDDFYQELLDYVTHQKARRELFSNE
ncbi:YlxR family protein [Enterococcus sp. 669A]|uniref:YlxR family protein n=1 Tax=Candidatus Enterococcus moelleringii TaxID=2815325 RepID=A0ABS3LAG3_9ENTE|nr:YlxR family protein [Enterococcus sp. 669A]MBO1306609.1 YlxR family protein [Enterococcus sp. 669A]